MSKDTKQTKIRPLSRTDFRLEAPPGFEPGRKGFADLCLTTWLWCHIKVYAIVSPFIRGFSLKEDA